MEDRPKRIKAELYPYDSVDVDNLLTRLQSAGFIERYEVGDLKVIQVVNFTKHQRIQGKESLTESEFPKRETTGKQRGNNGETTGNTGKERKGIGKEEEGNGDTPPIEKVYIVPLMQKKWIENFPTYTPDKDLDFEALGKIVQFMLNQAGVKDITDERTQEKILATLQQVADEVKKDHFWINKPLKSIAGHIQEFYNKIKNPQKNENKRGAASKSAVQDALNRRIAEQGYS